MFPVGNCQVCLGVIRKTTGELTSTLDVEEMLHHIVRLTTEAMGVLRLYTSELREFKCEELGYIRKLADLGTQAPQHARLYAGFQADHSSLIGDFHHWFECKTYN